MENKEVIVLMGSSGSGKSRLSKMLVSKGYELSSLDEIRKSKYGYYEFEKDTPDIFTTGDDIIKKAIREGKNVVIDNMNISYKYREKFVQLVKKENPNYIVKLVYLERTLEQCLKQNRKRTGEKRLTDEFISKIHGLISQPNYSEGFDMIYIEKGDDVLHLLVPED